jgi:hypothetical protein
MIGEYGKVIGQLTKVPIKMIACEESQEEVRNGLDEGEASNPMKMQCF